jgi:ribulose-phosphate 3-epimerase
VFVKINPSILSADFGNLEAALRSIDSADAAHVDVMDNHFVPNLTIGFPVVKRLQEISPIPLDVHLQIERPDTEALRFAEYGVESITFQLEAAKDALKLSIDLRSMGIKSAVSVKPATSIEEIFPLLSEIDMILVMTVEPGFGGQKLIEGTLEKIPLAREAITLSGRDIVLQVDGGVTVDNIGRLAALGADCFVAGSAVFNAGDPKESIARLRLAAQNA